MFSTTSFAEPKLSKLVPILTGESNFALWSTALKCALDTRDPYLFEILTGHIAQPALEDPSLPEWSRQSPELHYRSSLLRRKYNQQSSGHHRQYPEDNL
ncbi:hypothetical protein PEXP_082450 [Penicillium expansum]|nr:hypothetical protein PEXP_082450 [Penicillium expansum]